MAYVIVFLAALVTGALAYWLTLRAGLAEPPDASIDGGGGFLPEPPGASGGYSYATSYAASAQDGRTYVPIGADRRSWQTRTVGVLGLLIAVTLAAAILAFSLYQGGSLVAKLINDYAS
ncbi:MAG: hypothetical protein ACXWEJ_03305 [Actinomycetota bacterium]